MAAPATPPAAPFDVQAHEFRDAMLSRADGHIAGVYPFWHGWALVEAFEAGRVAGKAEQEYGPAYGELILPKGT